MNKTEELRQQIIEILNQDCITAPVHVLDSLLALIEANQPKVDTTDIDKRARHWASNQTGHLPIGKAAMKMYVDLQIGYATGATSQKQIDDAKKMANMAVDNFLKGEIDRLQKENEELKAEVKRLKKENEEVKTFANDLEDATERLTIRIYQDGKAAWEFTKGREAIDKYKAWKNL